MQLARLRSLTKRAEPSRNPEAIAPPTVAPRRNTAIPVDRNETVGNVRRRTIYGIPALPEELNLPVR
jgi:hypothetical protein